MTLFWVGDVILPNFSTNIYMWKLHSDRERERVHLLDYPCIEAVHCPGLHDNCELSIVGNAAYTSLARSNQDPQPLMA